MVSHQSEEQFVTDQFLNLKPEVQISSGYIRHDGNFTSIEQSGQHTKRGSITSVVNSNHQIDIKCQDHNEKLKYFCCDCS